MRAETKVTKSTPSKSQAAPRLVVKASPAIAGDHLNVGAKKKEAHPLPSPVAKVPGEDVRNTVSLLGTILGPIVSARQFIGVLANATFNSPLVASAARAVLGTVSSLSKWKVFQNPALGRTLQWINNKLPWLGAGLFAFDSYAFVKTLTNKDASTKRKWLTAGRWFFNGIATVLNFNKRVGMLVSLPFSLVGNGFEIAMAKLNADEAKAARAAN